MAIKLTRARNPTLAQPSSFSLKQKNKHIKKFCDSVLYRKFARKSNKQSQRIIHKQ